MSSTTYLGIDFGTSNSTCSIYSNGDVEMVPLEDGKATLPSALFFCDEGDILYGREAIIAYIEGEEGRLMRGLKSVLGTPLMKDVTRVQKRQLSFEQILTVYIKNLKDKAEDFSGQSIKHVVMGRPVHFHDDNPEADAESEATLKRIAETLGFKHVEFKYEPIAAAFAHEQKLENDKLALVVDLGGGTSDFTVIKLSPNRKTNEDRAKDILATAGVRVGGTNFDKQMSMKHFMPYLGLGTQYSSEFDASQVFDVPLRPFADLSEWPLVHFAQTSKSIRSTEEMVRTASDKDKLERLLYIQKEQLGHAFLQEVEGAKIALTYDDVIMQEMKKVDLDFNVKVTRQDFEHSIQSLIEKVSKSMQDCVDQSAVSKDAIDLVILTGGSSELPIINTMVENHFPNAELYNDDKFGSVGLGLAHAAGQVF